MMRLPPSITLVIGAALVGACATGPGVDTYTPALTPAGAEIRVRTRRADIRGELLEVRDSGIVVLTAAEIVYVPFPVIASFALAHEGAGYVDSMPTPDVRERLRLLSRFPTGLAADPLARLLAAKGQQSVRSIEPPEHHDAPEPTAGVRGEGQASRAEAAFLTTARTATRRYQDLAIARADGYRRIGGELPSLGEHWVHNGRALADTLDPASPPILVYVRVDGRPVLAGVAYTRFLDAGEPYPTFPVSDADAWHDHNGDVGDEILPRAHHASPSRGETATRLRVVVMHAWLGVENPAGIWASENWALPYVRLGLPATSAGRLPARGVSLAASADYYRRALMSGLGADEQARVERIVSRHSSRADSLAAHLVQRWGGEAESVFADLWESMWRELGSAVEKDAAPKLASLRHALEGGR